MRIQKYKSIAVACSTLADFWKDTRHGFQNAEVLAAACSWRGYAQHGGRVVIYVVYSDKGDPLLVAPLRDHLNGQISVLGSEERFDYVDMIVGHTSPANISSAFRLLLASLRKDGYVVLRWKFLDESSPLSAEMKRADAMLERTAENVAINLRNCQQSDYAKRRVRVATNHIKTDGVECVLNVRRGRAGTWDQCASQRMCLRMYIRRLGMILHGEISVMRRIKLRYLHYMSQSWRWSCVLHIELRIAGRIAAFMDGLVSDGGRRVEVPRVAMNPEFARYTPGYLLMDRAIKWIKENDHFIEVMDLGRGKERYKFDFGGAIVRANDYILELGGVG